MHKIIHDTFEFDLSSYQITVQEDNFWFKDGFVTKFSFPFTFSLNDELIKIFGAVLDDNALFSEKTYNITYVRGNLLEKGIFIIESQIGEKVKSRFRYGLEQFPNFNTKLSDFNLPKINYVNPYLEAKTRIWSDSIVFFPEIYTDKFDNSEPTFATFQNVLNNFDTATELFLENDHSSENFTNQNILHPCWKLQELIDLLFNSIGWYAGGNLYVANNFDKLLIYGHVDFFTRKKIEQINVFISYADRLSPILENNTYQKTYTLDHSKKYRVKGKVFLRKNQQNYVNPNSGASYSIDYNGTTLANTGYSNPRSITLLNSIDFIFETSTDDLISHEITFNATEVNNNNASTKEYVYDVEVIPVVDGASQIPDEIINNTGVFDLSKCLPDITFGKLITEIRKMFNFETVINNEEKIIEFNLIETELTNKENTTDLSSFEVIRPEKTFNTRDSFCLKYKNDDLNAVFVNREGVFFDESLQNDKTEKIEIDVKLLQYTDLNSDRFRIYAPKELSPQDICLFMYDYQQASTNKDNRPLYASELLPNVLYEQFYFNWFHFLLYSTNYRWVFKLWLEQLERLNKKCFAYGKYQIIKSLESTEVSKDLYEIEIETESLE